VGNVSSAKGKLHFGVILTDGPKPPLRPKLTELEGLDEDPLRPSTIIRVLHEAELSKPELAAMMGVSDRTVVAWSLDSQNRRCGGAYRLLLLKLLEEMS